MVAGNGKGRMVTTRQLALRVKTRTQVCSTPLRLLANPRSQGPRQEGLPRAGLPEFLLPQIDLFAGLNDDIRGDHHPPAR